MKKCVDGVIDGNKVDDIVFNVLVFEDYFFMVLKVVE